MRKRVTTKQLGNLLLLLKQRFAEEIAATNVDRDAIDIYANVLSVNYKTMESEQTRIPDEFLTRHNLPIPTNSTLQIHIDVNKHREIFEIYLSKITQGLKPQKDFEADAKTHHITLQNLKVIETIMRG